MLRPFGSSSLVGVEAALEGRGHQHARVGGEDVLAAVAVVHVEVDEGHALEPVDVERVADAHGDVVEEAEAHRRIARGVVPRRAHGAEGASHFAPEDEIGREHGGARRAQRGLTVCGFIDVSGSTCT